MPPDVNRLLSPFSLSFSVSLAALATEGTASGPTSVVEKRWAAILGLRRLCVAWRRTSSFLPASLVGSPAVRAGDAQPLAFAAMTVFMGGGKPGVGKKGEVERKRNIKTSCKKFNCTHPQPNFRLIGAVNCYFFSLKP